MSFDILTVTYRNHEWVRPFLLSLKKTLDNKDRRICIIDSSPLDEFNELCKINTLGLDVSFIHFYKRDAAQCLLDGIRCLTFENPDAPICIAHIDTIFLLHGWDTQMESRLTKYHTIGVAPRFKTTAETTFLIGSKRDILEAGFRHGPADWDESIMPRPISTECAYFTYMHHLRQIPYLLFDQRYKFDESRWGEIIYDDMGKEFVYHNYYAARCKKENDIPAIERKNASLLIESCESNAKILGQLLEFDLEYSMRDELLKMN